MFPFDFAFAGEKIIEPLFRTLANIGFMRTYFTGMQTVEDDLHTNYYRQTKARAAYSSTRLQFEWILNDVFNTATNPQRIYIQNTPSTDFDLLLFNAGETVPDSITQTYLFNDSSTSGISYSVYGPFNVYNKNQIVRGGPNNGKLFIALDNPPQPFNSLFDPEVFYPQRYTYNEDDVLNSVDFVVYVPQTLFTGSAFDLKLKQFITRVKMFHVGFDVVYYV